MEISKSKLSNYILFSSTNINKLLSSVINESCNAVMLENFDDKVLMADINTGKLYLSDYNFDGKKIHLENFEPVDIVEENSALKESISNYFEADSYDTAAIVEAFEEDASNNSTELSESIVKALARKRNDIPNYTQLMGINEEISEELKSSNLFKAYQERLLESPTEHIKVINWIDPVDVSIVNEDSGAEIFAGTRDKLNKLLKDPNFKAVFKEAIEAMVEGDDSLMEDLYSENKSLLLLSENELKEFVGLSIIGNKELMDSRKKIVENINYMIDESEELYETKVLFEEDEAAAEEGGEEDKKELAANDKDIEALQNALDKALEKITDEKLVEKINSLKDALDNSKDNETTDVAAVKECVEILSM